MTENCHAWYLGGVNLESRLRFLILSPKIDFWVNLDRESQSCPFCLKIGKHAISKILILIPTLVFWIFDPKSTFGQIWAKKVKTVPFCLKIGTWNISSMLILILTLVFRVSNLNLEVADFYSVTSIFWNSKPKSIFLGIFESKKSHFILLYRGCDSKDNQEVKIEEINERRLDKWGYSCN